MDIYTAISTRKSVRSYEDKPVPDEVLTRILEAARIAPSASNRQEWRFVVVRDPETRKQLVRAAHNQSFVGQAPVVLACCAETDEHRMPCGHLSYTIDVAIAVDHITLCAAAMSNVRRIHRYLVAQKEGERAEKRVRKGTRSHHQIPALSLLTSFLVQLRNSLRKPGLVRLDPAYGF